MFKDQDRSRWRPGKQHSRILKPNLFATGKLCVFYSSLLIIFIIQMEKSLFLQIPCTQRPNKAFRKFPNQAHGKCGEMPCQALQVFVVSVMGKLENYKHEVRHCHFISLEVSHYSILFINSVFSEL